MVKNRMMINKYADALYKVANHNKNITQISENLHLFKSLLKSIPELNQLLTTHRVSSKNKIKILDNIISTQFSNIEMDLILLLVEDGNFILFKEVVKRFDYLMEKKSELIKVKITSTEKISNDEVERISDLLESKIQKKISLETEIDNSVLGGIRLRVGNTLIDGSISNRLQKIRDTLIQG